MRFERAGIAAVIHAKPERKRALPLDRKLYKIRYLVELFFHKLKRFCTHALPRRDPAQTIPKITNPAPGPGRV